MNLRLKLNARFQPMHRFELEDALQEILSKEGLGEITGGGTAQNPDGEIAYCDIDIHLWVFLLVMIMTLTVTWTM